MSWKSCLEHQGLLEQDTESAWLELDPAEDTDTMPQILGSSVSHRIAIGPQQGRKAFMIRTVRPPDRPDSGLKRVAKAHSPTVFDSKRAKGGGDAACCHRAMEGLPKSRLRR